MNGYIFLEEGRIATTNLYSYTHPDFPFLNHHWGSGVLFELARRFRGFEGLSLFAASIVFLTSVLYARIAWLKGNLWTTIVAAILIAPVLSSRAEIRPELLSYFLSAVFLWILMGVRGGSVPRKALIALPFLMLLWVNFHIYFFLGIGWIGAFMLEAFLRAWLFPHEREKQKQFGIYLFKVLCGCCLVSLFNPNGWRGAVYPLLIFQNYAYAVSENQSIWATERNTVYPPITYFKIAVVLLGLCWAWVGWKSWRTRTLPDIVLLILTVFVSVIAAGAIRNLAIFAYVALVSLSYTLSTVPWPELLKKWKVWIQTAIVVLLIVTVWGISPMYWNAMRNTMGIGLISGILRPIEFIKEQRLTGPIFNNYDIGGYLTYGFYPQERVFLDNRPEAYPGEFFTDTLYPMQMDENVWKSVDTLYRFNLIIFYRHDATRWGQGFMVRRLQDPSWAPIYVDGFVIIYARRAPHNAAVIEKYELPKSLFEVKKR